LYALPDGHTHHVDSYALTDGGPEHGHAQHSHAKVCR
jgi:hypothetical protein